MTILFGHPSGNPNSHHAALAHFLRRAQARGARVVLVITGKGVRTDSGHSERGVLRQRQHPSAEQVEIELPLTRR